MKNNKITSSYNRLRLIPASHATPALFYLYMSICFKSIPVSALHTYAHTHTNTNWLYTETLIYAIEYFPQNVPTLVTLLVCLVAADGAHASLVGGGAAVAKYFQSRSKRNVEASNISSYSSSVEDWQLVCEHLCRWVEIVPKNMDKENVKWCEMSILYYQRVPVKINFCVEALLVLQVQVNKIIYYHIELYIKFYIHIAYLFIWHVLLAIKSVSSLINFFFHTFHIINYYYFRLCVLCVKCIKNVYIRCGSTTLYI